jgi:uncharacterized membrane protein HdeD (DUF308 family)
VLVASGIVETVQAFRVRRWGGFFIHLIGGVLGVLVGLLIVTGPPAGAFAWTLLFASFFSVLGAFRLITAAHFKFPRWGWVVFDGAVTLVLRILLANWPWSELLLGLAVGVSLVLRGWSYITLALVLRNLPLPIQVPRAA